ncbi:hypothetical protein [Aureimonas populi]|uniref:DNA methyltransferase n=1 Tax=Aureimonas populi TaxID=1701758 RepID=A0ABW5CMB6_9HYPH|nr:hypothetical protein [Aureimonas populi]
MAEKLAGLKGALILSINDRPEVRAIFERFEMEGATTTYSISKGEPSKVGELIVSGGFKGG